MITPSPELIKVSCLDNDFRTNRNFFSFINCKMLIIDCSLSPTAEIRNTKKKLMALQLIVGYNYLKNKKYYSWKFQICYVLIVFNNDPKICPSQCLSKKLVLNNMFVTGNWKKRLFFCIIHIVWNLLKGHIQSRIIIFCHTYQKGFFWWCQILSEQLRAMTRNVNKNLFYTDVYGQYFPGATFHWKVQVTFLKSCPIASLTV